MSMEQRNGWIWMNGEWLPWGDARVHVMTHTLHYGYGCFEGIRAYPTASGPALFRLDDHIRRLRDSARLMALDLDWSADALADACREAVRRNGLTSAYLRPLLFLGAEKAGVDPAGASTHGMIAAWEWGAYLGDGALDNGIRVKTSSFVRASPNAQLFRVKAVAGYANSILACREVRRDGYDEALLLDGDGYVAEGSGENVFIVRDGELIEPDSACALDGITRRTVIALAADMGLTTSRRRLTRDDLYLADEMFFTGTAAEVTPVVELDRRQIGDGRPGPVTRALQARYFACVRGEDRSHPDWLQPA